ncbi:GIY-YIG nuclease family protein [Lysobacter panacisoli]|uniref:GIY-YIG nuclease family protein n=1 Tax=Lysobacter panacisoli TaxID=1255263 RepID=A0ABP9LGW7_9GAMM|nr:GIY-YIG nuclease family protein [Lysobacter panacisoli]
MEKQPAVYMLSSRPNGTIYVGVTSNLIGRTWQHREHLVDGFTRRHDVARLVWYELWDDMAAAIQREKQQKKWNRAWKIRLIAEQNPEWSDLWPGLASI